MRHLKYFMIATLASIALTPIYTSAAIADDAEHLHGGFYLGATIGASAKGAKIERGPGAGRFDMGNASVGFGIVGGYNWIIKDRFMLGVESDIATVGSDANKSDATLGPVTVRGRFVGSIRARAGIVWQSALFYGTAGLALSDIIARPAAVSAKNSIRTGVVVGLGVEYAFDEVWTGRLEGLAYSFEDNKTSYAGSPRKSTNGFATIRLGIVRKF